VRKANGKELGLASPPAVSASCGAERKEGSKTPVLWQNVQIQTAAAGAQLVAFLRKLPAEPV